jgi:hypothetical protein
MIQRNGVKRMKQPRTLPIRRRWLPGSLVTAALISMALTVGGGEPDVEESRSAQASGISVIVQMPTREVKANEPISMRMQFRNQTGDVLWLPPLLVNYWALHVEDVETGRMFTGVTKLPMGMAAPLPTRLKQNTIQPNEVQSIPLIFPQFGFVSGDVSYSSAKDTLFVSRAEGFLPVGSYRLSVEIRSPLDYLPTKSEGYDQKTLWKDSFLRTNPVMLEIAAP